MQRTAVLIVLALLTAMALQSAPPAHSAAPRTLKVMTWNVYIGSDFSQVLEAESVSDVFDGMAAVYNEVLATDFRERARAIAEQIEIEQPHLVGLQEVALWRNQDFSDGPINDATHVAFDFLKLLLEELEAHGQHYSVLDVFEKFDLETPARFDDDDIRDIRFTDRDVVLRRSGSVLQIEKVKTRPFASNTNLALGSLGTFRYTCGWTSVDARFDGKKLRFINTHLDAFNSSVRNKQAKALMEGPAATGRPVILVGDFNSPANFSLGPAYRKFINADFVDAWAEDHSQNSGNTCCQDSDLRNEESELNSRIDLVLLKGDVTIQSVRLVGEAQADRSFTGMWPSDHAGIIARLTLE